MGILYGRDSKLEPMTKFCEPSHRCCVSEYWPLPEFNASDTNAWLGAR